MLLILIIICSDVKLSGEYVTHTYKQEWRRIGLMVSVLNSGLSGLGSSPGQGHCVVFLGKTLYSHSASLHPGVQIGTSKNAGGNPAMD